MLAFVVDGFEVPFDAVALGVIVGLVYGLLAVGLVLVYRSNRIINFAHGEIGAFGASVFGVAVVRWHVPYYAALPFALALSGAVGAGAEVAVIRRLRKAPRLMSVVATLGVGQFLLLLGLAVNTQASAGSLYPRPPFLPSFSIGALYLSTAYTGMLLFAPTVAIALAVFLRRSPFGLGIRASAANPEAARMAGIFSARMSSLAWALAGALSALTAILVLPTTGFTAGESFGPALLLRALAAAVIAKMTSIPRAIGAAVGLGVVEQLLLRNFPRSGVVEAVLFVIILVALLAQRRQGGRDEEKGSWAAVQAERPLPDALQAIWEIRNLGWISAGVALVVAAVIGFTVSNASAIILCEIVAFSIVGLSVGIISGLGGQLSLGQFALAAVGATISYHVATSSGSYLLAFVYAALGTAAVAVLVGLPSLRVKGLMVTVTTLSFALVVPAYVLQQSWALGSGQDPGRPTLAHHTLVTARSYFVFALLALILMLGLARNVRRGSFGRLLVAVRDNEDNARAFGVNATVVKLQGFALSGFMAGIGGAVFGHLLSQISTAAFPTASSVDVAVMTVLGGVSTLAGPLLGALYVIGIPKFLPLDSAGLAATKLGALLLILYFPGGVSQLLVPLRDRLVRLLARRRGIDVDALDADRFRLDATGAPARTRLALAPVAADRAIAHGRPLLVATGLRKSFGGVQAVRGVTIEVLAGETLGLIGPNGAGKTTTFELLGGFVRADEGTVVFEGDDVSSLGPEGRAHRGIIRSFQDAALFPTLTVLDSVCLSLERLAPSSFLHATAGLRRAERVKAERARELIAGLGLDAYRDRQIQELSTGTRRICEIACLVALEPTLLLLDEPSSGIAQRETEALGTLLRDIKHELDLTLIVIEHDIPLIMGLSDRIVAMADGEVIASGAPEAVRHDPRVVEAYLGGSIAAIERSGPAPTSAVDAEPADALLAGVSGLGASRRARLADRFATADALRAATVDDLTAVDGIGPRLAARVLASIR